MSKPTGGPAFPDPGRAQSVKQRALLGHEGMTLRDYFAAKAMQGMLAAPINGDHERESVAQVSDGLSFRGGWRGRIAVAAYAVADAMLMEREK